MISSAQRKAHLALLSSHGLEAARSLPLVRERAGLRAPADIAARLCALDALFSWVVGEEACLPEAKVRGYVSSGDLESAMTPRELAIWRAPRASARAQQGAIGWRLENMWPLAWALGFEPAPAIDGAMITEAITAPLFRDFMPKMADGVASLVARVSPRSLAEVEAQEDLFYCAHNAARSIQLGQQSCPEGWHPIASCGVVHERRHALTWCLSTSVAWDDVDLST